MTYDMVKDHIVQHVQKNYEQGYDVATTLRDLQKKDFNDISNKPTRVLSTETDSSTRAAEQEGFDIIYKAEVDEYV